MKPAPPVINVLMCLVYLSRHLRAEILVRECFLSHTQREMSFQVSSRTARSRINSSMETDILFCPACQGKVRIPRDLLGTAVRCPLCQAQFTAPPPPIELRPQISTSVPSDFEFRPDSAPTANQGTGVILSGIAVVVTSLLSILACLFRLYAATHPDVMQSIIEEGPFGPPPPGFDLAAIFLVWGAIFLVVSLVAVTGGFAMVLRRGYAVALIGSIASLLNVADCCCLPFNFLAGLIALIVLLMPDGRQAFHG